LCAVTALMWSRSHCVHASTHSADTPSSSNTTIINGKRDGFKQQLPGTHAPPGGAGQARAANDAAQDMDEATGADACIPRNHPQIRRLAAGKRPPCRATSAAICLPLGREFCYTHGQYNMW